MRNTLIFPPSYELQLIYELKFYDLIKLHEGIPFEEVNNPEYLLSKFKTRHVTKQKIYQMFLLFEDILMLAADSKYEYSGIEALGNFKPIYPQQYQEAIQNLKLDEHKEEFALYLKPALIPELINSLEPYYILKNKEISLKKYINELYDFVFRINGGSNNDILLEILNNNNEYFAKLNVMHQEGDNVNYQDIVSEIINSSFEDLSLQLDICSNDEAYMLNSVYKLDKIGCFDLDFKRHMSAYSILRVECKKIITEMPGFKSILDVIKYKEKRRNDIYRLRQQLDELEYILRTQTREDAINKAAMDVQKAVRELNRFFEVKNKIGSWTTYISVPVGVAEFLLSLPPVMGLSLSLVGLTSEVLSKAVKKRNNWVHVVR